MMDDLSAVAPDDAHFVRVVAQGNPCCPTSIASTRRARGCGTILATLTESVTMNGVLGIHHITAIASDPQRNLDFYIGVLGMRFVKRTVNFDDPGTYHFYFGDETGTPGSILTFFPWPGAERGRRGRGQVAVISFAVRPGAIEFWTARFAQYNIHLGGPPRTREGPDGGLRLRFVDPDGLVLELAEDRAAEQMGSWNQAPGIPPEFALHGFESVTLRSMDGDRTERVLHDTLGFRLASREIGARHFTVGDGRPAQRVILQDADHLKRGVGGAGTVHHIAWRVPDDDAQLEARTRVLNDGLAATPVIDRNYFHSVYFREPGGILFELATDPPGFAIDEPPEHLGETLCLPPQLEHWRAGLEATLPAISPPVSLAEFGEPGEETDLPERSADPLGFVHRYLSPTSGAELGGGTTLLLLHGTGGDEDDLVPLGRELLPGAGLLSPRGKVLERGAPRFFRRLAEGVFDLEDLARRTDELAGFVLAAIRAYGLDPNGIVAVGFSNGANIAVSLLLAHPGLLRAAVLLSPMLPFTPERLPELDGTPVFIGAGRNDAIAPRAQVERLADVLRKAGADVAVHWVSGGHAVSAEEIDAARQWMMGHLSPLGGVT